MTEALLVSNIVLWIIVIVLTVVVLALARQVGILHERVAPAGALMPTNGPKVGELTEAMALADRIAVMDAGRLVQVADPRTLYREPATVMVADFIGQGEVVSATVTAAPSNGRCPVDLFGRTLLLRCRPAQRPGPVKVSLRPESLALASDGIAGHVRRVVYRGGTTDIEVMTDGSVEESLMLSSTETPDVGARVRVDVADGWIVPEP